MKHNLSLVARQVITNKLTIRKLREGRCLFTCLEICKYFILNGIRAQRYDIHNRSLVLPGYKDPLLEDDVEKTNGWILGTGLFVRQSPKAWPMFMLVHRWCLKLSNDEFQHWNLRILWFIFRFYIICTISVWCCTVVGVFRNTRCNMEKLRPKYQAPSVLHNVHLWHVVVMFVSMCLKLDSWRIQEVVVVCESWMR